jgi:hypothetical protein
VPCLVISLYAKKGFVDHDQAEFASFLKFIETVYALQPLTQRDAMANDMMEAFDLNQRPRGPLILPGQYIPDHYPLMLRGPSTNISIYPNCPSVDYGQIIALYGTISPSPGGGTELSLDYSCDGGITWLTIAVVKTDANGAYACPWRPSAGSYEIRASWNGSLSYQGSMSELQALNVEKATTSLTISVSKKSLVIDPIFGIGDGIEVSGSLSPVYGAANITLVYTRPDGSMVRRESTTTTIGSYTDVFYPERAGTWMVVASWPGDANYKASSSQEESFNVMANWLPYIGASIVIIFTALFIMGRRRHPLPPPPPP